MKMLLIIQIIRVKVNEGKDETNNNNIEQNQNK